MLSLKTNDIQPKKAKIVKNSDPLDPRYVLTTTSGRRRMLFGGIDGNRPKE